MVSGTLARVRAGANQFKQRDNLDFFAEQITVLARINDQEPIQLQVFEGNPHRRRERRRVHAFALDAHAPAVLEEQQVELRPLVRGPEIGLVGLQGLEHFLHGKSLPRCADLRVKLEVFLAADA